MDLRIVKIKMDSFKGITHKEVVLNGKSASLCAENGGFKTTTADAFYFCMANSNMVLVNNPDVVPIGAEECQPTVEIDLMLDGKPLKVRKVQKFKKKEVDGKVTSSTSNTYFINEVEKSYTDYLAELNNRGIDTDNFLVFSNPNAFMADTSKQGREKIRKVLFEMCNDISDADIVHKMNCAEELKDLIETYRIDEIEQMNRSLLKKINEEYGKDNSIVRARIEELIKQKSNLDENVLLEQQKNYEAEVERINDEIDNLINGKSDVMKKLADAKMERDKLVYAENNKLLKQKSELESAYQEMQREISDKKHLLQGVEITIADSERFLEEANADLEKQRSLYKMAQETVFDEADTICPTCMQVLPKDKIEHLKANFDKEKADRIKTLKASGKALNERVRTLESTLDEAKRRKTSWERSIEDSENLLKHFEDEIKKIPNEADMSGNEEYLSLLETIADIETNIPKDNEERIKELKEQRNVNKQMLNQTITELAYLSKNEEIDNRIAALREETRNAEIRRAEAEKILFQIDTFKRCKNEMLTEEINKHFKYVNWHLFRFRKNGEYEEITEPYIGNKSLTAHSNQALQVVSKMDIINGLSNFFDMKLPIFIDDASLLTQSSIDKMQLDNQLIFLRAKDGYKEMVVENA